MAEARAADHRPVTLPERVTVLTCIGCGAMGRQERCVTCSEHKLELVREEAYEELLRAAAGARDHAHHLAGVVRDFAALDPRAVSAADGDDLRRRARDALRDVTAAPPDEGDAPDPVTGWWCAECGNVDMPQPCIGVCVWQPAEWVNHAVYERERARAQPWLRADHALTRFLARAAAARPRTGQETRHWQALREQAAAALGDYDPDAPAPQAPPPRASAPGEPALTIHTWPR